MHDARMLAVSQLYDDLQNFAFDPVGRAICLYGDPANPLRVHLKAPFRVGILTRDMEMFNESMYIVFSILRNGLTCLYSNTTAEFFALDPPSLNDYFN